MVNHNKNTQKGVKVLIYLNFHNDPYINKSFVSIYVEIGTILL